MTNEILPILEKYRYTDISNKKLAEMLTKLFLKESLKSLKNDSIPYANSKSNMNNG